MFPNNNNVTDEILHKAKTDIEMLLRTKALSKSERVQLEVQSYFLMFLVNDRKKIGEMYPFFIEQKAAAVKRADFWGRFSWLIITLTVTAAFGIIGQALYFWFRVVPELTKFAGG